MYQLMLFTIFIISHMVQSVPLNHDQRFRRDSEDIITIKDNFYCAAKLFKDNAGSLNQRNISINLNSTDIPVENRTAVLRQLFNHFSEECKDFTKAMSLKHQLQDYLFNHYNLSLTTEESKRVHSILVGLQTTANILDQYRFSQHNKSCPRLSEAGYKMMYHVQYNTSLVEVTLGLGEKWVHDDYPIYGNNKTSPTCM